MIGVEPFRSRRISLRSQLRALVRTSLLAGLGLASSVAFTDCLQAQDVNNSSTKNLQTNAVESAVGDYNNLSAGVLNFNGPSGAAEWSAGSLIITNAGQVNLVRANLGIIGDVTNTGTFQINALGGIVQVDGHFTVSGTSGVVNILGGGMELIGDGDPQTSGYVPANFTNESTASNGVVIAGSRYLVADTITNANGSTISSNGRIEGRTAIINNGTINSNASTSILKGNITNNYILNASGAIEGNLTNAAGQLTTVTGNLAQTGNLTNSGTLDVSGGNLTQTGQLTNSSIVTIANNRSLTSSDIKNNSGGTVSVGDNATLSGTKLENSASITVGTGGSVRSTGTTANENLTNNATGTISFNGATGTANLSSASGTIVNKGLINLNAGSVLVTGNLTDSGTVAIANGATFKSGSANQLIANAMTLAGTSTIDTNGNDATVSSNMSGAGGLTKKGSGELTLQGINTFSGATAIDAGQMTLKGGSALKDSNAVTVGAAGKFEIQDSETIGSLAGAAGSETILTADLRTGGNNSSTTYSGKISGDGRLIKEGSGTMTLAGSAANTFTGGLYVDNGTVAASTDEQLGTGNVEVGPSGIGVSAGTVQIDAGTTQTVAGFNLSADSVTGAKGTLNNSGTLTSANGIGNNGTLNNVTSTSIINGDITSSSSISNNGTINGFVWSNGPNATVDNNTATSTINGGLRNQNGSIANNTGTINGGVNNTATLNSDTATSVITGGLTNRKDARLRNQVSGAILNGDLNTSGLITVTGDLVGDSTLVNQNTAKLHVKDGNFTGITTLTNSSTNVAGVQVDATRTLGAAAVTNQYRSTIVNSGTLQSGSVINNSGTITNNTGATVNGGINNAFAGALVTNNGTVNGGITGNFGTVDSLNANSVINGGVSNSAYVNARGQISGAIVNNAQHTFTDVTLSHAQANAAGTVTFGSGPTAQTFNLAVTSGTAGGTEGNGTKDVNVVFGANPADVGTSSYDPNNNTITVYVAGVANTTVQDIQTAINNGSGFTASGGTSTGNVDAADGLGQTNTLTGGRNSGTALIRVLADATGSAAQNTTVSVVNDNTIANNSAVAAIDSATGDITVRVNGNVGYNGIATAIDNLSGFNASVATSMGDQGYQSTLDTPPSASTMTNGVFNVEGNLAADNTLTNGGHLNLNNGNLTGITTLTNTGDVFIADGLRLETSTTNNNAGTIDVGYGALLYSTTATNNSSVINVYGEGSVSSDGTITNNAGGNINFGQGSTAASDVSELYSDTNTIVNNGQINVDKGVLNTTGNVSGTGTIAMKNGTTFSTGNSNQTITNSMTLAAGSATFDTDGNDATVSGAISGSGGLVKTNTGNLTLSGTNTFIGPAAINGGRVTLQGGSAIADSTAVQLNSGSLTVSTAETIGSLATSVGTQTTLDATLTTGGNNTSTTSSGAISGSGGLVKQGTGTMTLNSSSANTFSGGTTVSGGTLSAVTNEQLGTGSVTVASGATLTTGNSTTQTVAGLNNQGTLSLGNSSTLYTGANHFINSGTVNAGTSGSIIDSGAITNSGTINFNGGTATLSSGTNSIANTGSINLNSGVVLVKGNLTGNGSINMNNGTTLRSGNANQQIANGIAVNTGTAIIDTNGNNVNLTGTITGAGTLNKIGAGELTWVGINNGNALINSGVLITSTQSQVGNIQITNGSGVIFSQNTNGTYTGNVTGNGSYTKTGSGTVTMTGTSVYTGGTSVVGGTLRVGNHGTGSIQSNVNVGSSGTLGGGGTVIGNVTTQSGGHIAAGNSIGTLNIIGNFNATGSTIDNELNGTTSDLINVTGVATISGATLANQFDPTATYTTRMYRAINATGGISGRFSSVTQANPPSNFLISTYYTPTTANVVLTSLADATLASSTSTSLLSTGQDYLTTIMNQVNGYQFGGLGVVAGDGQNRVHRNVWFKGVGFFNDINAVGPAPGYKSNTGGGIVGVDRLVGPFTRLGIAGGYTFTDLTMRNAARATADVNSARVNLYGTHSFELVTLSGIGGYAHHDVNSKRNLSGIGTARGNQSQNEAALNFQLTVNPIGEVHWLMPYVGVQWVHLTQEAYGEHGTPGFDMSYNKANVASLRPYVGTRYQYKIFSQSGLLTTPYLFARYSQETITNSNLSTLSINGSNFIVAGVQPNRNIVGLGGGINAQLRQNIDWYANYNIDLGDRGNNQNAAAGLGFKF
ncbi:MAG: autotransporter-associated beta strand repeat-containing protein [Pirellulales bacterium]